ncbi:MAG TPA: hypothetical protein VK590_12700 [Saprospiraceae bacterium]|nr:hypothetical protein [Saprospiraceae bacterium]
MILSLFYSPNVGQNTMDYLKMFRDIILPFSALLVSIFIYLIYRKQADIQGKMFELAGKQKNIQEKELEYLNKQIMLQRINFEPKFQIKSELKKTANESFFDTEFLYIENDGYFISEFQSIVETFYSLSE